MKIKLNRNEKENLIVFLTYFGTILLGQVCGKTISDSVFVAFPTALLVSVGLVILSSLKEIKEKLNKRR